MKRNVLALQTLAGAQHEHHSHTHHTTHHTLHSAFSVIFCG